MVEDTNDYTLESMARTLADLAAALRDIGRANRLGAQVDVTVLRLAIGVLSHQIEDRIERAAPAVLAR